MESPSDTALLIVILIVSGVLVVLFFTRLHQLGRGSKEGEVELKNSPGISRPNEESALHSPTGILDIRSSSQRAQESFPSESRRPTTQAHTQLRNPRVERVLPQPNVSTRLDEERTEMLLQQSGRSQILSPKNHISPPSLKYPDSLYSTSTLPSYPETTQSRSPPAYSDLSRTQSRRTVGELSQRMTPGESAFEAMSDLVHLEEGRQRA